MLIDARTATFERIELLWKPALRTREQVDRSTLPIGWHCYELYAAYACDYGRSTRLMDHAPDGNFVGTILISEPVPFHRKANYHCVYGNVVGFDTYYTIEQFCKKVGLDTPDFWHPDRLKNSDVACAQ